MAMTLTPRNKAPLAGGLVLFYFDYTASGSGDTATVAVSGPAPIASIFTNAGNQVITNLPTFGSWTTTGDVSSATLTANSGGAFTGQMILICLGS